MNRLVSLLLIFGTVSTASCGTEDPPPSPPNDENTRIPLVMVTHAGGAPLAAAGGDFAFADVAMGIAGTVEGLLPVATTGAGAGRPPAGYQAWTLSSSTGFGAAAGSISLQSPQAPLDGVFAFFFPAGRPQVGAVEVITPSGGQGQVLSEALLDTELVSPFPSALETTEQGLWVVDAVFGPGSTVRHYPYSSFSRSPARITEDGARRFTPALGDVDGDTVEDQVSLNKLTFVAGENIGLVSFSFLAPAPAGAAGGVLAFDLANGRQLGRIILPITSSVAGALEFVGSVRATDQHIVLISAQKSPAFTDLGGVVAIYEVESWRPFRAVDTDASRAYDQPEQLLPTSRANPIGLALRGKIALVVDAPFGADGALDVIRVDGRSAIASTTLLGPVYTAGFAVPGDPKLAFDGKSAIIPAEVGLLRVELD